MLYVSRQIGRNKYMVKDTDDGVEEAYTLQDLEYLVGTLGFEIYGTEFVEKVYGTSTYRTLSVKPYTLEVSQLQNKMRVLKGVEYQVDDTGMLTHIAFYKISSDMDLRLSDICNMVGDYVLDEYLEVEPAFRVILTLDDNVKLHSAQSFRDIMRHKYITLNLSEVDDKQTVERAYAPYLNPQNQPYIIANNNTVDMMQVLDDEDRCARFTALRIVSVTPKGRPWARALQEEEFIAKTYRKQFVTLSQASIEFKEKDFERKRAHELLSSNGYYDLDASRFFEKEVIKTLGRIMGKLTNLNAGTANRFMNYMIYFGKTPELRHAWVRLCENLLEAARRTIRIHY